MKTLLIFFSNGQSITLEDNDNESINEYVTKLSKILESNNIVVLHTSTSSLIIRPNTIFAIHVFESNIKNESIILKQPSTEESDNTDKKIDEPQQDIISD